jgi:hypothetical protein
MHRPLRGRRARRRVGPPPAARGTAAAPGPRAGPRPRPGRRRAPKRPNPRRYASAARSRRTPSSSTSGRLQNVNRTSDRPTSGAAE